MGLILTVSLIVLAFLLFIAVKKGWIGNENWQILIGVTTIVGVIAAVAVFVVPAATNSESNQFQSLSNAARMFTTCSRQMFTSDVRPVFTTHL